MIALDEDALICDFAETYGIYSIESLDAYYAAILANGLRDDSRIMLKINGLRVDTKTLLLAHIADNTAINVYAKTKDATTGKNKPKSLLRALTKNEEKTTREFETGDDFIEEWRKLNGN